MAKRRPVDKKPTALARLDAGLHDDGRSVRTPEVGSFREFLETQARVPAAGGEHGPYSFVGREALIEVVETIDLILGSHTGQPLKDAEVDIAGGAQFGKSILELNFGAYATGLRWLDWGFYLPDGDLVEGMVDTKFRPDILDQIDWFAQMTRVGKALNKSGKAVNRKGAFTVTDGQHHSQGMIIGLNKVPTSFSFDVTTLDEVDDIKPKMEKFVRGRMTSSDLRFTMKVGTQRVAGRGMHKAWKEGSQGVQMFRCPHCGAEINLEESWPACARVALSGTPRCDDPQLTLTADFRRDPKGEVLAQHDPAHSYYYACTECGTELDRQKGFRWHHRRPELIKQRRWSFRISQYGIAAIELSQIVGDWVRAVADPEAMVSFNCDRRAMPESTEQKLSPTVLDRARSLETFDMRPRVREGCTAFGGLDTGRRCWFFAREVQAPDVKRVLTVEQIPVGNLVRRAEELFHLLGLSCLFIDQAPETDAARTIALQLNGLSELTDWPTPSADSYIAFPSGLRWNGPAKRWENLRCAVVAFTKLRLGSGITHAFDQFEKGGHQMFVPLIQCNRYESIDRAVREFLTPSENVSEVIQPKGGAPYVRTQPSMRLPRRGAGSPVVLEALESHLLVGSERTETASGEPGDYVDKAENHFLLADAYSALAETVGGTAKSTPFAYERIERRGTDPMADPQATSLGTLV